MSLIKGFPSNSSFQNLLLLSFYSYLFCLFCLFFSLPFSSFLLFLFLSFFLQDSKIISMFSRIWPRLVATAPRSRAYTTAKFDMTFLSLGNPSPKYDGTRHNVGSWVLDEMQSQHWTEFSEFGLSGTNQFLRSTLQSGPHSNVALVKSVGALMNIQGRSVEAYCKRNPNRGRLIVVHDELQIPLGQVQVRRRNTSARGHNGLRSVDKAIGNDYTKIGIGIGRPQGTMTVTDFVLGKFTPDELAVLRDDAMPQVVMIFEAMCKGEYINDRYNGD